MHVQIDQRSGLKPKGWFPCLWSSAFPSWARCVLSGVTLLEDYCKQPLTSHLTMYDERFHAEPSNRQILFFFFRTAKDNVMSADFDSYMWVQPELCATTWLALNGDCKSQNSKVSLETHTRNSNHNTTYLAHPKHRQPVIQVIQDLSTCFFCDRNPYYFKFSSSFSTFVYNCLYVSGLPV